MLHELIGAIGGMLSGFIALALTVCLGAGLITGTLLMLLVPVIVFPLNQRALTTHTH